MRAALALLVLGGVAAGVWHSPPARRLISRGIAATGVRDPDPAVLSQIVGSLPTGATPTETLDAARIYVHTNSEHAIDDEHASYAFDTPQVLERLLRAAQDGAPRPHLSCGPRAFALGAMLQALGFERRHVSVFKADGFLVHSVLEVKNPDTDRWEIQDPDMDFVYIKGAQRCSARDLLLGDLQEVRPEGAGDPSDWLRLRGGAERGFFAAVLYNGTPDHERSTIVVNPRRLDPDAVDPTAQRSFREHARALYGDARIVEVEQ